MSIFIADQIFGLSKLLKQYTEEVLKPYGIGTGQLQILMVLYQQPGPIAQSLLPKLLGIDKGNVSRSVSKLEERGYIHRPDRRTLALTEQGMQLKEILVGFFQNTHQSMTQNIPVEALEQVGRVLSSMTGNIQDMLTCFQAKSID